MKEFKLKNYTTVISPLKTISEIEEMLALFGARDIIKNYDINGHCEALIFSINLETKKVLVKIPINVNNLLEYFYKDYLDNSKRPRKDKDDFLVQAYSVAWRLAKEWIHIQLTHITTKQFQDIGEAFFQFILIDKTKTVYNYIKENNYKLLPSENEIRQEI